MLNSYGKIINRKEAHFKTDLSQKRHGVFSSLVPGPGCGTFFLKTDILTADYHALRT